MSGLADQRDTDSAAWVEGLPTQPGHYWFFRVVAGYPEHSRYPEQGRAGLTSNGYLMVVAFGDWVDNGQPYDGVLRRIWHRRLVLPSLPPVATIPCPTCKGTGERWASACSDCRGKGEIGLDGDVR